MERKFDASAISSTRGIFCLRSQADALAEEIRQQQAHPSRARAIGGDERADGVEAIEEEMRIDLGSQRLELRLSSQNLVLQRKPLRFPGDLKASYYVVHGDRKIEKEDSHAEQQRDFSVIALTERGKLRDEREQGYIEFTREDPPGAGEKSRDRMDTEEPDKACAPKRERAAQVPAGKTDERILGCQRERNDDATPSRRGVPRVPAE